GDLLSHGALLVDRLVPHAARAHLAICARLPLLDLSDLLGSRQTLRELLRSRQQAVHLRQQRLGLLTRERPSARLHRSGCSKSAASPTIRRRMRARLAALLTVGLCAVGCVRLTPLLGGVQVVSPALSPELRDTRHVV